MTSAPPAKTAPNHGKVRSGLGPASVEVVETFSDSDRALATGLLSILGPKGKVRDGAVLPALSNGELVALYRGMLRIRIMDGRLLALQRQGRIGFYGEGRGQEAAVIGAAAALDKEDYVVPALREAGAALFRGLPMRAYVAQIFGNRNDLAKGRQMPCHPGSRATRYVTMSSCVATQIPHATGLAWAARISGHKVVVLCFLGDGATSEEDFHTGVNFAGVYKAPVVFVCQNNQWAISTPGDRQTASETMACKALAYGIPGVRVDGNDILAVYSASRNAVERARSGQGPTLIEALTYRMGAHSSSDDPTRYRDERVTVAWGKKDPISRFRTWLLARRVLGAKRDAAIHKELDREVRDAIAAEEDAGPPPLGSLVDDVFAEPTAALREQLAELRSVREKYGAATG